MQYNRCLLTCWLSITSVNNDDNDDNDDYDNNNNNNNNNEWTELFELLSKCYSGDQIKEDVMGRACGTYGEVKCIRGRGEESWRKATDQPEELG
jgi:hypothetical protein